MLILSSFQLVLTAAGLIVATELENNKKNEMSNNEYESLECVLVIENPSGCPTLIYLDPTAYNSMLICIK